MTSRSRSAWGFLGWLALCFVTAAIGAAASIRAAEFYQQLAQPSWAPPASVFSPVWTALYCLMAVAAWLVWKAHGWQRGRAALTLFIIQLAANALWSWLFFGWHLGALASAEILVLWVLILATVVAFWRLHRLAGLLLLPYLAWVSFASFLCFSVWRRNPGLL
jgi:tryptophan-rich sensory protein